MSGVDGGFIGSHLPPCCFVLCEAQGVDLSRPSGYRLTHSREQGGTIQRSSCHVTACREQLRTGRTGKKDPKIKPDKGIEKLRGYTMGCYFTEKSSRPTWNHKNNFGLTRHNLMRADRAGLKGGVAGQCVE